MSGDRGCFPAFVETAGTAVAQTTTAAQVFVASAAAASAPIVSPYVFSLDIATMYAGLCVTYGTCCTTSNCNSAVSIFFEKSNILFLVLASLIAKLYF